MFVVWSQLPHFSLLTWKFTEVTFSHKSTSPHETHENETSNTLKIVPKHRCIQILESYFLCRFSSYLLCFLKQKAFLSVAY